MTIINSHKSCVVIPAFNEASTIQSVCSAISSFGTPIVVSDGSTDKTDLIAAKAGAIVISLKINKGYDNALVVGLSKAIEYNYDFAFTIDGDGQHDHIKLKHFLHKLINGSDLVVGVRDYFQRPSESLFARVSRNLWRISDPLCGMKGYRLSKLKCISPLSTYNSIGTEIAIRAVRSGWDVQEVNIQTKFREGKSRFGSGVNANWRIIQAMIMGIFIAKAYAVRNNS